jgi:hypothetical protein
MEINLEQLKRNFLTIKDIREKVINIFTILENYLLNLKKIYSEFVENNRQNLFVFGLDSFQFQSKLIDIEYEDMKRLFLAINNRMYCEYYKLYKIIAEYVKENINDKKTQDLIKITNIFPIYKDLEPYKQYNFEIIQDIHENIILLLYEINEFIINKQNELQTHKRKQDTGLNINNFVSTFNYNIIIIKEKGMLFISYIEFFHNLHTKYLQRFAMKMNLMYNQVSHDIRFEDSPKLNETKKNELLKNYETDNIDKNLIRQIKKSFNDSDSNNSDIPDNFDNSSSNTELTVLLKKNITPIITDSSLINIPVKEIVYENNQKIDDVSHYSPKNSKMKDLFKTNVKKLMNGMSIFKKKNENSLSSDNGRENIIKDVIDETKQIVNLNSSESNVRLVIDENMEKNRTKSAEEIFMEITKQCNLLTDNFVCSEENNDEIELIDIYKSNEENLDMNENKVVSIDEETVEEVMEEIIQKVENVIIYKVEQQKYIGESIKEDENISVITMESINNEKNKVPEQRKVEEVDEKNVGNAVIKKKRSYKPRKKTV